MFWSDKGSSAEVTNLTGIAKALAVTGTVQELVRALEQSEAVRSICDCVAVWHQANGSAYLVGPPDSGIETIDLEGVLGRNGSTDLVELRDLSLGELRIGFLCPLSAGPDRLEVIGFFRKERREPKERDRAVARIVASLVALSLENIHLRKEIRSQTEELRVQKQHTEDIIDSMNSGIVVVDQNGMVLKANPLACSTFGVSKESIEERNIEDVIPNLMASALRGRIEGSFTLRSGQTVSLGFSVSDLNTPDGLRGSIILFRDLSEILELRAQIRRKTYFETVGETASWIAHEVKTPLFAIASIAKLLSGSAEDPERKRLADSILKETDRLGRLLEDVLQYGRPLDLNLDEVVLTDLAAEIKNDLQPLAVQTGCSIELASENGVGCRVDRDKMSQVFHNIVKNSIDAGSKNIRIEIAKKNRQVEIVFSDDGAGIKEENLTKVFRPFFSTKRTGTGLGLPICKKIVEEHGGAIEVKSERQRGTEVRLTLKG